MIKLLSKGTKKNQECVCLLIERWRKEIKGGTQSSSDTSSVLVFKFANSYGFIIKDYRVSYSLLYVSEYS